jgi:hypothetical protein
MPMKKLLFLALMASSAAVLAQSNMRVRGTISSLDGDVLSVKSREGKDLKLHLTPDAQVAVAKKLSLSDIKPGTYVGVTSVSQGGKQVAKEVHLIPPAAPSGHMDWDLVPGSKMTNANLQAAVAAAGGNEITLKYKDGEQRIMVPNGTPIVGFDNGDRSALKKGETIWTNARVEGDGKLVTNRVQVSKGGVKPEH